MYLKWTESSLYGPYSGVLDIHEKRVIDKTTTVNSRLVMIRLTLYFKKIVNRAVSYGFSL